MDKQARIFVVEDDDSIRLLLEMALKSAGYKVCAFTNADDALCAMGKEPPDAALLDIMMDGTDGVTAMRIIRADAKLAALPVMMLTARDTETDKVLGLDAGADDYMTKPFSVLELCARVRALLRRGTDKKEKPIASLDSGALQLAVNLHEAYLDGALLELTYKEYELLSVLMQNAPRAISREELLQTVWGYDFIGETRTLDMHIGTLRSKLMEDAAAPRFIKTVRGVGYRFLGEVKCCY
ncbi:MAG: response regulator transcription factor [Oscillospiraceae bacterium]